MGDDGIKYKEKPVSSHMQKSPSINLVEFEIQIWSKFAIAKNIVWHGKRENYLEANAET